MRVVKVCKGEDEFNDFFSLHPYSKAWEGNEGGGVVVRIEGWESFSLKCRNMQFHSQR